MYHTPQNRHKQIFLQTIYFLLINLLYCLYKGELYEAISMDNFFAV